VLDEQINSLFPRKVQNSSFAKDFNRVIFGDLEPVIGQLTALETSTSMQSSMFEIGKQETSLY